MWTDRMQEVMVVFYDKSNPGGGGGNEAWHFEFSNSSSSNRSVLEPGELEDYMLKLECGNGHQRVRLCTAASMGYS